MAQVTASLVKELRDRTGLGMMECKRALAESDGDIEKAIEWVRNSVDEINSIEAISTLSKMKSNPNLYLCWD